MSNELNLGKNQIFADDIKLAADLTKIDPAAIAAVIDMEARKEHGVWQATPNPKSSAQGVTQFVSKTWLGEAQMPGRYLNQYASEHGLIDAHNHIVPGRTKELLDLRQNSTLAIVAAAQYDAANYRDLAQKGVFEAGAPPAQQARDLYTVHLLGARGAREYIEGTTSPAEAHLRLKQNSQDIPKALAKFDGSLPDAWHAFVDSRLDRINVDQFRMPAQLPVADMAR